MRHNAATKTGYLTPAQATLVSLLLIGGATIGLITVAIGFRNSEIGLLTVGGLFALGLAVVIFVYPETGAYVLALTIFTNVSSVVTDRGYPGINKPLVILVFVSVLAQRLLKQKPLFQFKREEGWMIAYAIALFLSIFVARDLNVAFSLFIDYAKDFIIILTIIYAIETKEAWRRTLWMALGATTFLASLTAYQVITRQFTNEFFGFALVELGVEGYDVFEGRITGPFADPNFYGQILVAAFAIALYRALDERKFWWRLAAVGSTIVILFSAMNTFSRGAFLALAVIGGLTIWERKVKPQMAIGIGLATVLGLFLMPAGYVERLDTFSLITSGNTRSLTSENSFRGRASEAVSGMYMFAEHPILGVGAGNYIINYQRYAQKIGLEQRAEARRAHSLYVEIAAETGLFGVIAFAGIFIALMKNLNKSWAKIKAVGNDPHWLAWVASIQIGIISYLVTSIFLHNSYIRFLWLLVALAIAAVRITARQETFNEPHL